MFFLCLNLPIGIFALYDPSLGFSAVQFPDFYDIDTPTNSTTAVGNLTNPSGSYWNGTQTVTFSFLDWFTDATQRIFFAAQIVFSFIGLGFIFSVMDAVSTSMGLVWPAGLVTGLSAIFGVLFLVWLAWIVTGRGPSGFV
jgi:hypothetical protein